MSQIDVIAMQEMTVFVYGDFDFDTEIAWASRWKELSCKVGTK